MNIFIYILLIVLDLFWKVLFFPSSSIFLWFDVLSLMMCLVRFFFFMFICIVDFCFVAPMRFLYHSLYMYKIVLRCWYFNFKCISNILHLCSPLLTIAVLISCLCVDDFLHLLYVCFYQWAFPFIIFLSLVVAFSFLLREVPLAFVEKIFQYPQINQCDTPHQQVEE